MNIGNFSRALLLKGLSNSQVLAAVKVQFADAKTTSGCIAWYKADLRKKGMIDKSAGGGQAKAQTKEQLLAALDELVAKAAAKAAADAEAAEQAQ